MVSSTAARPSLIGRMKRGLRQLFRRIVQPRKLAFWVGRWRHGDALSQRSYDSYDAYLDHQRAKLATRTKTLAENRARALANFKARFSTCTALRPASSVLCLGARTGTEVEAFIDLGHFAVGIDLEPGPDNSWVVRGDFHDLVFADGSLDAVYTNCLDHLFDLKRVAGEIARVLKPGGIAIIDIVKGYDEGFTAGEYESTHWATAEDFAQQLAEASGLARAGFRHLDEIGQGAWYQLVLRRSAAPAGAENTAS